MSVHTKNILSMYLFQYMGEGFFSERILDSSAPMKMSAYAGAVFVRMAVALFLNVKFIVESQNIFVKNEF